MLYWKLFDMIRMLHHFNDCSCSWIDNIVMLWVYGQHYNVWYVWCQSCTKVHIKDLWLTWYLHHFLFGIWEFKTYRLSDGETIIQSHENNTNKHISLIITPVYYIGMLIGIEMLIAWYRRAWHLYFLFGFDLASWLECGSIWVCLKV